MTFNPDSDKPEIELPYGNGQAPWAHEMSVETNGISQDYETPPVVDPVFGTKKYFTNVHDMDLQEESESR